MKLNALVMTLALLPAAAWCADTPKEKAMPSYQIKAEHAKDVERIERYLTNLSTIIADFVQVAPDGSLSSGKMFVKRPDKMRWVYDPPTPIIMNTRGSFLTYYDFKLDQVSDIPLDSTMLSFFTQKEIKFGQTIKVVGFENEGGVLRIELRQASKPEDGKLTLELTDNPLTLKNFIVRDVQGQDTTVSLNNSRFDVPLDDAVFAFQDPRMLRQKNPR